MTGYLLDTHALIWWNTDDGQLGVGARRVLEDPDSVISPVQSMRSRSPTKHRLGKLPLVEDLLTNYHAVLRQTGFLELAVDGRHALCAGGLMIEHRDPSIGCSLRRPSSKISR